LEGAEVITRTILVVIVVLAIVVGALAVYFILRRGEEIYNLKNKRVLVVLFEGFQPAEFHPVRNYLQKCGAEVKILSLHRNIGVSYDMYIYDVRDKFNQLAEQYDAIVIIGGEGVYRRVTIEQLPEEVELLQELVIIFNNKGKLVAAICAAPAVLARAGILKGVKATCFPDNKLINILKEGGAQYTGNDVEIHHNIITGKGPGAAGAFAKQIARYLSEA